MVYNEDGSRYAPEDLEGAIAFVERYRAFRERSNAMVRYCPEDEGHEQRTHAAFVRLNDRADAFLANRR